jgi:transcriptional regulator GlxA family with amidase domain
MIGAKTRPHLVCFEPGCEITAVRIKLEWVRPMLGVSPADHADGEHDLPALFPSFALTLFDELVETTAACQVAAVLEAAVARRLRRTRAANDAPGWALDLVRRTNGRVAIERIAGRMGVSLRHLRRMVRRDAGVSLKGYARTHRLVAAMTEADRSTRPGWARLAVDSGFYDQSHLVRECQALCSLTPVEVHRERRLEAELSNPA